MPPRCMIVVIMMADSMALGQHDRWHGGGIALGGKVLCTTHPNAAMYYIPVPPMIYQCWQVFHAKCRPVFHAIRWHSAMHSSDQCRHVLYINAAKYSIPMPPHECRNFPAVPFSRMPLGGNALLIPMPPMIYQCRHVLYINAAMYYISMPPSIPSQCRHIFNTNAAP